MATEAIERTRVVDAVRMLARYNLDPFITNFLRKQPEPPRPPAPKKGVKPPPAVQKIPISKYDKDEVCTIIRQVLLGEYRAKNYRLELDALVGHLDELQETGRQHVYLFQLPADLLPALRDFDAVKKLFGGDDTIYGAGVLEWEARDGPRLVRVWNDANRLLLKWIETREYWIPEGSDEDELAEEELEEAEIDRKTRTTVRREERAVSFFVVHTDTGECELRIQAIRGQSKEARLQQLATYRAVTGKLLGVELVGPTVLAPAIRRALMTREVDVVYCAAVLPKGGRFVGKKGELPPVDIRQLEAGVKITFTYKQPGGSVARIELDGRLDEIFISRAMVPDQHRLLIERIHRWRQERLDDVIGGGGTGLGAPAGERQIDQAIREYSQTHELTPDSDPRALEQFLQYIAEVARREHARFERELKPVRDQERAMQRLFTIAAVLALLIFTTGAILVMFTSAKVTIAMITSLLTLLTGTGTLLVRANAKTIRKKRERLEDQQRDSRDTLIAIQMALSIPDPALRSKAMVEVTFALLRRVTSVIAPAPVPAPPSAAAPPA